MDLEHSFIIPVPPEQAWQALLDVEQVAPCMPGATVDAFDGEVISGKIKVKVGPVQMTYAGTARFTEKDEATKTVVLEASGKETRGSGTASATVRSSLQDEGGQTRVLVRTSMTITGRPAQFGRGVIAEVGGRVIGKFATNLAAQLSGEGTPAAASGPGSQYPGSQYPGVQCPGGGDPGHEHPGRGGRDRGQRRGRGGGGSGAAADRGAGPAGPLLQQPAARGRAHGREPRRPDGEGAARHRRSRAPVDQGDQGQARRPRAGPHHARRDHGRGPGHRCRGRFRRPGNQRHERGGHHEHGELPRARGPARPRAPPARVRRPLPRARGAGTPTPRPRTARRRTACCRRAGPGPRTRRPSTCSAWPGCRCSSGWRRPWGSCLSPWWWCASSAGAAARPGPEPAGPASGAAERP